MSTATRIIFIGFSMPETDVHFKYLLAAGLQENISLRKIYYVDKNIEHLKNKEYWIFNNNPIERVPIDYISKTTEEYFSNYNLHSVNRNDFFETAVRNFRIN